MSRNIVITISREFGSGGREIGQKVAKALGISFYERLSAHRNRLRHSE